MVVMKVVIGSAMIGMLMVAVMMLAEAINPTRFIAADRSGSQRISATTKFNVPTPITYESSNWDEIDIIIVPLLVFDNLGNRIGYGKGIYDAILEKTRKNCIKIGVSFFKCSPLNIDSEPHDISLNYCQTPFQLNCFN